MPARQIMRTIIKMINQEEIFQAIQKENWKFLLDILYRHKKDINSDPLLNNAAKTFINVFLEKIDKYPPNHSETIDNLEKLFLIHQGSFYKINDDEYKKLISQIVQRKNDKLVEAFTYAKLCPEEPVCQQTIKNYENLIPKLIEHSQSEILSATERKTVANVDYTSNLFKSKQEIELFYALKKTFDSYQIYPNVSISCLLNWQLLNGELTAKEKDFYFKGIVDFVVFDQAEGFKPIHFFELDSSYHDTVERQNKDTLKDSIFAKAGVKIIRIRKRDKNVSNQDFIKLIRELIK